MKYAATINNVILLVFIATIFSACHPNLSLAKKIKGSWVLSEWRWAGTALNKPAGSYSGKASKWIFTRCTSGRYEGRPCNGSVTGFEGSDSTVVFSWYIFHRGTHFSLVHSNPQSSLNHLFYGGNWEIVEVTRKKLILSSETCATCAIYGKTTLVFIKS